MPTYPFSSSCYLGHECNGGSPAAILDHEHRHGVGGHKPRGSLRTTGPPCCAGPLATEISSVKVIMLVFSTTCYSGFLPNTTRSSFDFHTENTYLICIYLLSVVSYSRP